MGKPWKKREKVVSPDAPVDYKWSSQSYTMKEILTNFKLPVVVQCREETYAEHVQNFFFELRQPIMVHNKRTIRKVFARCIRKGDGGTVKELLPEVVIPEDYAGWFKISKGLNFDKPSPHKTIHSLTRTNTEFFLCTTDFDAFILPDDTTDFHHDDDDDAEEDSDYVRPVVEGEILRKTGIQKINQMLLPESLRSMSVDNRYLMCIDEKDNEFFIPLGQEGLFYEVSDGNLNKNDNSILQIPDILDEMVNLPIYVRHILGDPPPISKFYSPCLKLVRIKEEETVMGATLDKGEEILPLEIQTNSPIKFKIALNTPMLQSSLEYIEAVDLCDTVCQSYLTDMKLAVKFKVAEEDDDTRESHGHVNQMFEPEPEINEVPDSICNSQRTSSTGMSEYGETEANSEFSIQWNPAEQTTTSFRFANECTETDTDCLSIDSINVDNADKFNGILGGNFVSAGESGPAKDIAAIRDVYEPGRTLKDRNDNYIEVYDNSTVISDNFHTTLDGVADFSNQTGTFTRGSNKYENSFGTHNIGTVDFSENSGTFTRGARQNISGVYVDDLEQFDPLSGHDTEQSDQYSSEITALEEFSSPRSIMTSSSPFRTTQASMTSSLTSLPVAVMSNSSNNSSTLTISSGGSRIDLKDHFPSMSSSSGAGSCESVNSNRVQMVPPLDLTSNEEYTFTGDVYINHDDKDTFDDKQWGDKYKVVTSKDLRCHGNKKKKTILVKRPASRSLSDDLINFEEVNRTGNSISNGIITCQVADEMMSSYNDLRLSLEEVTKTARDNHFESRWKDFCLERSSSLPVRSKQNEKKQTTQMEDYSQSWEQISPRHDHDTSVTSAHRSEAHGGVTSKTLKNLNIDIDSNGDEARLISDTSSEESGQLSHRSFTSEGSELHFDAFTNYLPVKDQSMDVSVRKGHTITRDKSKLARKMKVRQEIQRKQLSDWNDVHDVI